MTTAWKHTGKATSVTKGIAMAAFISIIITAALSAAIAYLLNKEKVTWDQAGYWIMGMLFVSSYVGGKIAYAAIKRQRAAVTMMSGVLYWGLLLCATALFWGGHFDALWETAGIIGAGCGTAALISMPKNRSRRQKRGGSYR